MYVSKVGNQAFIQTQTHQAYKDILEMERLREWKNWQHSHIPIQVKLMTEEGSRIYDIASKQNTQT